MYSWRLSLTSQAARLARTARTSLRCTHPLRVSTRLYSTLPHLQVRNDNTRDSLQHTSTEQLHEKGRTLVLCFDGTGDQFDDDNSNVVRFFSMLKKGEDDQQLVYYQVSSVLQFHNLANLVVSPELGHTWHLTTNG